MEQLKHECGIALCRLKKPVGYYASKYGTPLYALNKLYLLMQKQHNRGQEGAGAACVSLEAPAGEEFMFRERKEGKSAITDLFATIHEQCMADISAVSRPFVGECYMGHLRYSTTKCSGLSYVHPHLRRSGFRKNTLAICGNFNLTDSDRVFEHLTALGQHPRRRSDTTIILEQLGLSLDNGASCEEALRECSPLWDGGFIMCGLNGEGEMFALRDPWGIRTAFYYQDDEMVVAASERPAIQTVVNAPIDSIREIEPGQALFIDSDGNPRLVQILEPQLKTPCSFERIYFSRGNDRDIYLERKELGRGVVPRVMRAIDGDLANTVFSFIPNTAEVAFMGMVEGVNKILDKTKAEELSRISTADTAAVEKIIGQRIRVEKVAIKDIKLRTFISEHKERSELVTHVYDITYGSLTPGRDNLVIIDDSIVRGTTLRDSIITILSRLDPKKLVVVSSAPQIRYPDFYGIDMSDIGELIAFHAALALNTQEKIEGIYARCKQQQGLQTGLVNYVQELYSPFSDDEVAAKIAQLITPESVTCPVEIIFQNVGDLDRICAGHSGDWYFSGDYPTEGGLMRLNDSFIRFYERTYLAQSGIKV